jgi:hypothetical protein
LATVRPENATRVAVEALPAISDGLRAKGLEPVTLTELLLQ